MSSTDPSTTSRRMERVSKKRFGGRAPSLPTSSASSEANVLEDSIDPLRDVQEFHEKFGLAYNGPPRSLPVGLQRFRTKFLKEELKEYTDAVDELSKFLKDPSPSFDDEAAHKLEKMLDALVDLLYVLLGTAYLHGFGPIFRTAWRRVHRANMSKIRVDSKANSKRKSEFDVVKPPGWQPPTMRDLVATHLHR